MTDNPDEQVEEVLEEYFPEPDNPEERDEVARLEAEADADAKAGGDAGEPPSFDKAEQDARDAAGKVNIIVIGETGVGKSTLINAVFADNVAEVGVGKPVTSSIQLHESDDSPVRLFDTPGLKLDQDPQAIVKAVEKVITDGVAAGPEHHLHLAWFCTPGSGGKAFQESTRQLFSDIAVQVPTFFVATQVPDPTDPELEAWLDNDVEVSTLGVVDEKAFCVLAEALETSAGKVEPHGVDELIARSLASLPEAKKRAFAGALRANDFVLELQAAEARKVMYLSAIASAGVGATPLPPGVPDAALIAPIQAAMIARINLAFGVNRQNAAVAALVTAALELGIATGIGKAIASEALKFIPGAGNAARAAVAGSVTLALGEAYIRTMLIIRKKQMMGEDAGVEAVAQVLKEQLGLIDMNELKKLFKDLWRRRGR